MTNDSNFIDIYDLERNYGGGVMDIKKEKDDSIDYDIGGTFSMRGRKPRRIVLMRQRETPAFTESDRRNAWKVLNNVVSGIIFILIAVWAVPQGIAKTGGEIATTFSRVNANSQIMQRGQYPQPVSQQYRVQSASVAGNSAVIGEDQVERGIALPVSIAREVLSSVMPRDQFDKLVEQKKTRFTIPARQEQAYPPTGSSAKLQVSAIVCDKGECFALIGSRVLKTNDTIRDKMVEAITPNRIILSDLDNPHRITEIGI